MLFIMEVELYSVYSHFHTFTTLPQSRQGNNAT